MTKQTDEYRRINNDELIDRLGFVLDDISRLKDTTKVVNIGIINVANLSSMELHINRTITELRRRNSGTPDKPAPTPPAPEHVLSEGQEVMLDWIESCKKGLSKEALHLPSNRHTISSLIAMGYIFDASTAWHITEASRAALKAHKASKEGKTQKCAGCGAVKSLTECRAIPESTYHLCRKCLAEERQA